MATAFPLRSSEVASQLAPRDVPGNAHKIANLVALTTRLADRMDAMPSAGLVRDRDRRARVAVLRRTAEAGTRTLDGWGTGR